MPLIKIGDSRPPDEVSNELKEDERSSNTRRTCEFIPLDWETEMELARDEPLPSVAPIEENSSEYNPLNELSNNSSVPQVKTSLNVPQKLICEVPKISIEKPPEPDIKGFSNLSSENQVIEPSKPTLEKLTNSKAYHQEHQDSLISNSKSDKTKNAGIFTNHIVENQNLPIATPIRKIAPITGNPALIENIHSDSLADKLHSNLDLGVDNLPVITPVKNVNTGKENFINPLSRPRNFFRSQPHHPIHTNSKFSATPIAMDRFNKNIKTPINKVNLLKSAEISSASRIPVGKTKCDKFPKIIVNGVEYFNLKILGKGGSSVVYQCFDDTTKENRAIKCVSLDSPISSEEYRKEIEILRRLQNCDRIIKMYNYQFLMQEKKLYVVLEMGSVDLSQILKDLSKNEDVMLSPYLILFYWMEMLYAVQQIHSHGIIHSDLKPANFLQVNGRLKLIDFGISSCVQNDTTSVIKTVSEGSSNYISPEALNYEYSTNKSSPNYGKPKYKISYRADVWSLGCILYQLIYKKPPFHHISNLMQKLMAIASSKVCVEFTENDKIPRKFLETIKKCLVFNAKSRPSVDELIIEYEQFCKL